MEDEQMSEQEQVYLAALAGLLHDVGKFAQRAGWQHGSHTEVGGEFVRRYVPEKWREHLYPVMGHHDRPLMGYVTKIVALADRLSAGERTDETTEQPQQLLSVFCRLVADGVELAPEDYRYCPLAALVTREGVLFPKEQWDEARVKEAYDALWKGFARAVERLGKAHALANSQLSAYLESLLLLMQRYTWCVPSAYYRSLPDVSLYDHSRTTGALAVCLMQTPERRIDDLLGSLRDETAPVALLVGGDLSGVQDFIYTITARGAASALRGRSFYLQLLTEAIARFVCRELLLPPTNVIYQGGGGFYLLARARDADKLQGVQQKISRILLAHHRGDLYLALAGVPLVAADFYDGRISGQWGALTRALREAKQRRFAELDPANLTVLFTPQGHGGNQEKQCQVCGREHPGTCQVDDVRKCPPCQSYEALGDALRHARYLWLEERSPQVPEEPLGIDSGGWQDALDAFGLHGDVLWDAGGVPDDGTSPRLMLALKDDALQGLSPDARTAVGRRFLVNVTPDYTAEDARWLAKQPGAVRARVGGDLPRDPVGRMVKPFSVLEAQSTGIKRLGVLRMDVDGLGALFSEGFGQHATLSRVAALSFAVGLYFEGWVEALAERIGQDNPDGVQRLYSIYSGGDDLFLVGAWDAVVEFARAVRADLTRFAAGHPGIHASAGVALVGGKYPLYQAAADAGEAEGEAKSLRWRDALKGERRKDAVCFLGQPLPWRRFGLEGGDNSNRMGTVYSLARRLVEMVEPKQQGIERAPQALIRRLIQLQEMYEETAEKRRKQGKNLNVAREEQVYWGRWMWRGYYVLRRMAGKRKGEPWDSVRELAEGLKGENFRAIEWVGLAARYAELLMR